MTILLNAVLVFCLGFMSLANAADLPTVVEGAENESKAQCIATQTDECVQSICEESSDPNCSDECQTSAEDKCKELSE